MRHLRDTHFEFEQLVTFEAKRDISKEKLIGLQDSIRSKFNQKMI